MRGPIRRNANQSALCFLLSRWGCKVLEMGTTTYTRGSICSLRSETVSVGSVLHQIHFLQRVIESCVVRHFPRANGS